MNIGIYKITSPSGRVYIGQSKNIKGRRSYYKSVANKTQPKLYRSFLKYGFDNHLFEIVELCSLDKLDELERYYQEKFDCLICGLNCMYIATENKPSIRSQETKDKISAYQLTRVMSKETCEKISKSRTGIIFTEEHKKNIKLSKTGANNKRSKQVINLNTGQVYECIIQAAIANGITDKNLSRYLLGKRTNKTPHLAYV